MSRWRSCIVCTKLGPAGAGGGGGRQRRRERPSRPTLACPCPSLVSASTALRKRASCPPNESLAIPRRELCQLGDALPEPWVIGGGRKGRRPVPRGEKGRRPCHHSSRACAPAAASSSACAVCERFAVCVLNQSSWQQRRRARKSGARSRFVTAARHASRLQIALRCSGCCWRRRRLRWLRLGGRWHGRACRHARHAAAAGRLFQPEPLLQRFGATLPTRVHRWRGAAVSAPTRDTGLTNAPPPCPPPQTHLRRVASSAALPGSAPPPSA